MTQETKTLLTAFDALPAEEKQVFAEEVLRRSLPFDSAHWQTMKSVMPHLNSSQCWIQMTPQPVRSNVWLVDFGLAGKLRPALVVSINFGSRDRALITVVPHITSLRGSPFEIAAPAPFLKQGAFLVQGVTTFPTVRASHRLGTLSSDGFKKVFNGLMQWGGTTTSVVPPHIT